MAWLGAHGRPRSADREVLGPNLPRISGFLRKTTRVEAGSWPGMLGCCLTCPPRSMEWIEDGFRSLPVRHVWLEVVGMGAEPRA